METYLLMEGKSVRWEEKQKLFGDKYFPKLIFIKKKQALWKLLDQWR